YSYFLFFFFFSSRRRHTRCYRDWSSDVCSSDLQTARMCNLSRIAPSRPELCTSSRFAARMLSDSASIASAIASNNAFFSSVENRSEERRVGNECRRRRGQEQV